jgi:MFS family permease
MERIPEHWGSFPSWKELASYLRPSSKYGERPMWRLGPKFQRFLIAAGVSSLGDGLLVTGLPLLTRSITDKPILIASVFAAGRVPWAGALFFGAIADRRDARKVLVVADLGRALLLAILAAYFILGRGLLPVWLLMLMSALLSVGAIFFFAGSQRVLPSIVASAELESAYGALTSVETVGEMFVGPQLGAAFLAGGKIPLIGDAISFGLSGIALFGLSPVPPEPSTSTLREDMRVGWTWFRNSTKMRYITFAITWIAFLTAAALSTEVILINDTLQLSKWWFGFFAIDLAVGSIIGSSLASRVVSRFGNSTLAASMFAMGLCYVACVGTRNPVVVFTAMFFQQTFTMIGVVSSLSMRQRAIPAALQGRVGGVSRTFTYGSQIAGSLLGGWIIQRSGTDAMFLVTGTLIIVGALSFARPLRAAMLT